MFKILIGHIFEDSFVESDLESAILSYIHFLYAASEDGLKLGRFRVLIKLQIRNERFSSISWKDVMRIPEALAAGCGADGSGKLRGVAQPAGADARVRDAGEAV